MERTRFRRTTTHTIVLAARVINAIDYDVDPCDDFYEFSCGTWMRTHVVPEDRSNLYTYGVLRDQVQVTLKCKKYACNTIVKLQ